jgi:hypothetical protein
MATGSATFPDALHEHDICHRFAVGSATAFGATSNAGSGGAAVVERWVEPRDNVFRCVDNTAKIGPRVSRWLNRCLHPAAVALPFAAIVAACAAPQAPPPANPFVGTWATRDDDTVTIRQDTVVENQPNGQNIPLDNSTCNASFSFGYGVRDRTALIGLLSRQPNLEQNLSDLLQAQSYSVAVLRCDKGDHTYVLIDDRELLAIYRDGDIGVIQRLVRR